MFSACQDIQNFKKTPLDGKVMIILVLSRILMGFVAESLQKGSRDTDSSELGSKKQENHDFSVFGDLKICMLVENIELMNLKNDVFALTAPSWQVKC